MIKYDVQVFFIICTVNIYIEKYEIFGFVGGANCFLIRQKIPNLHPVENLFCTILDSPDHLKG